MVYKTSGIDRSSCVCFPQTGGDVWVQTVPALFANSTIYISHENGLTSHHIPMVDCAQSVGNKTLNDVSERHLTSVGFPLDLNKASMSLTELVT